MASKLLTKSKYIYGIQCPKLLWMAVNRPVDIPEPDAATQYIFDQGQQVGELAKKLYPDGIGVSQESFMGNILKTKELLELRKPLFEAGVMAGQLFSRTDILNPVNDDEWDIIEVKSSTEVKNINIHDVSFQKLCWEEAGLKIRRCFLAYINNKYIKNGEINPEELFIVEDISEPVAFKSLSIQDRVEEMLDVINQVGPPALDIGGHCSDPYDCPLIVRCWEGLPDNNVFTLYYGGKKSCTLYDSGIVEIVNIPNGYKLSDKQRIQQSCLAGNNIHVDKDGINDFLGNLEYPLYYLDFETFNTAIPIYDGTRPYQNIPFQFSLHIQRTKDGELEHTWYLADGTGDPRPGLLEALQKYSGESGSIVAYNKSFEENVLKDLALSFHEYEEWINSVLPRFVDLIVPFRNFCYYNPIQQGSASLKKVLPAVTGVSYDGMAIARGDNASLAYMEIAFGDVSDEKRQELRKNLLDYCGLDTEAMALITGRLYQLVDNQ
jgi:hypothetical protein